MVFLRMVFYDITYYGAWWLLFIAISFFAARYAGWIGAVLSPLVIAGVIVVLDIRWIFDEMQHHPENGRDADLIFWFGMLCRVVFFNAFLTPVALLGLWIRHIVRLQKRPNQS